MIHGAVYEARPEVNTVIHNHAYEVIPFGVTGVPLRPIMHAGGPIGSDIPTWDIRDKFGEGDHLVVTMDQGRDLVRCLGNRRVALMKRHGCVVTGKNVREAVMTAVLSACAFGGGSTKALGCEPPLKDPFAPRWSCDFRCVFANPRATTSRDSTT
jgi:ribulose-5-phosphate 4-epimerase/fuculose-1-phosphate aldolase